MMIKVIVLTIVSFLFLPNCHLDQDTGGRKLNVDQSEGSETTHSWEQSDTSIALLRGPQIAWQFNFKTPNGKPYFYPLNTVGGNNLAWLRPSDHPWHYGLWFSWKFINGKNYWEEDIKTRLSEGQSTIANISKTLSEDFSATVEMDINYSSETSPDVLHEKRLIKVSPPGNDGNYYIDWLLSFKSQSDSVILDRTPPEKVGGPYYGGYAGLSYRASQYMTDRLYMDSENWTNNDTLIGHGQKANWMDLTGRLAASNNRPGVTMFNHPDNFGKQQTSWYIFDEGDFAFYNAGLLFDEPIVIGPNDVFTLKYRVLVHDNKMTRSEINAYYKEYIELTKN
ncbi:MAG: PmoA family protein [Cyclobacteriaceae bacterium]